MQVQLQIDEFNYSLPFCKVDTEGLTDFFSWFECTEIWHKDEKYKYLNHSIQFDHHAAWLTIEIEKVAS